MTRHVSDILAYVEYIGDSIPAVTLDTATVAAVLAYVETLPPLVIRVTDILAYVEYVGDAVAAAVSDTAMVAAVLAYVEYTEGDVEAEEPPALVYGPLAYVF
jgi:hypothetical protein